jgi:hypothetical protein
MPDILLFRRMVSPIILQILFLVAKGFPVVCENLALRRQ